MSMTLTIESLDPRHLWPQLPTLARLCIFFLCTVSIYVLLSLVHIIVRIRSLRRLPPNEASQDVLQTPLSVLQRRLANLRQLLLFMFYLFALCFLLQIPAAFVVFGDSRAFPLAMILSQLATHIEYATDVCFLFLLLHSLQWFVSVRVQAFVYKTEIL
jgi:hypothetical protein